MEIADHRFSFSGEIDPVPFLEKEPFFEPFIKNASNNSALREISIEIKEEGRPGFHGMEKIFEGQDHVWHIYGKGRKRCFLYLTPASDYPLWTVDFDTSVDSVIVRLFKKPYESSFFSYIPSLLRTLLMYALFDGSGIIMHGAGAVCGGKGLLFCGKSGQGKTTLSSILSKDKRFGLMSDERIVIRRNGKGFTISGTPWPSDGGIAENKTADMSAVYFIHHGTENSITPVPGDEILKRIIPVATIPWHEAGLLDPVLGICESIIETIPAFDIRFRPEAEISEVIYRHAEAL